MPAKLPIDENVIFLYHMIQNLDLKPVQWEAVGARFGIKKGSAQMRWYNLKNRLDKEEGASAGNGRASGSTSAKGAGNLNGNQGGKAKSGGNGKGVKRGAMQAGGGDKAAKRVKRGKGEGGYEGEVDTDDEEDWKKEEIKDDEGDEAKEMDSEDDNDLVELKGGPVKVESD